MATLTRGDYEVAGEKDPELVANGGKYTSKYAVMQVTIRLPLDGNVLNEAALLYGFLPFIIPGALGVAFFATWHFIYLYGVLISLVLVAINEGFLKKAVSQPRPDRSANKNPDGTMKHGMPSGHVLNSVSLLVWTVLEVYLKGPGVEDEASLTYTWLLAMVLLMGPVPWARWYNGDHSFLQCSVSLVLGIFVGCAAFYLRTTYFSPAWKPWSAAVGEDWTHRVPIINAYRPPWVSPAVSTAAPTLLL